MARTAAPTMVRRVLYDAPRLRVAHIAARPTSEGCVDVDAPGINVLALPLKGLFAHHPSRRQQVIATANHAVLFPAAEPYRMSFPGCVGDEVIALQWSSETLEAMLPEANDRLYAAAQSQLLLEPSQMVRRATLWKRLAQPQVDPLEVETLAAELLVSCLRERDAQPTGRRGIERVKEAVALAPDRKWTLADLAEVARMSPFHLAHVFRRDVGVPVYAYVLRLRLAHSLAEIAEPGTDITSVALDAGFASHSHFTLHFRTHFGVTPAAFRRDVARKPAELRKIVTAR